MKAKPFLRAGLFLVVASVFLLFQVPRESAEFVVTVLTLLIGVTLAGLAFVYGRGGR